MIYYVKYMHIFAAYIYSVRVSVIKASAIQLPKQMLKNVINLGSALAIFLLKSSNNCR